MHELLPMNEPCDQPPIELVEYGAIVTCQDCGCRIDTGLSEETCGDDGRQRCDGCDAHYRAWVELPERSTCEQSIDSWDNPGWCEDGWTAETQVGLTGIGHLDIQLDELRRIIDRGFDRAAAVGGRTE